MVRNEAECKWRVGRHVGRTIYAVVGDEASRKDVLIGVMDTRDLATRAVLAHNALLVFPEPVPHAHYARVKTGLYDRIAALDARVVWVIAALGEAIALADEGWAYASDYFIEKWNYAERRNQLAAIAGIDPITSARQ